MEGAGHTPGPFLFGPNVTLPIAAEIDARILLHRQPGNPVHVIAVRDAPVILAP